VFCAVPAPFTAMSVVPLPSRLASCTEALAPLDMARRFV
jgi:hypothetical protein